jgi:hypothetical protein
LAARGQDWIWFHLSLIVQEENGEAFAASLRRLQQQVCKFGPDHFNAKKHPLLYFQVLPRTTTAPRQWAMARPWFSSSRRSIVIVALWWRRWWW